MVHRLLSYLCSQRMIDLSLSFYRCNREILWIAIMWVLLRNLRLLTQLDLEENLTRDNKIYNWKVCCSILVLDQYSIVCVPYIRISAEDAHETFFFVGPHVLSPRDIILGLSCPHTERHPFGSVISSHQETAFCLSHVLSPRDILLGLSCTHTRHLILVLSCPHTERHLLGSDALTLTACPVVGAVKVRDKDDMSSHRVTSFWVNMFSHRETAFLE